MATGESTRINRQARPKLRELREITKSVATDWFDLGLELATTDQDEKELAIIDVNEKDVEVRCRKMFGNWLKGDHVSWDQLIKALNNIGLRKVASDVEAMLTNEDQVSGKDAKTPSSSKGKPNFEQRSAKPLIDELNNDVRMKAGPKWKDLGRILFDPQKVAQLDTIEANSSKDIARCCTDMFEFWLAGNGKGPATWSSLIAALRTTSVSLGSLADEIEEKYTSNNDTQSRSDDTQCAPQTVVSPQNRETYELPLAKGPRLAAMPDSSTEDVQKPSAPQGREALNARPTMESLNRYIEEIAALDFTRLGLELQLSPAALSIVKKNHPQDVEEQCRAMMSKWLAHNSNASWSALITAVQNAGMNTLADSMVKDLTSRN